MSTAAENSNPYQDVLIQDPSKTIDANPDILKPRTIEKLAPIYQRAASGNVVTQKLADQLTDDVVLWRADIESFKTEKTEASKDTIPALNGVLHRLALDDNYRNSQAYDRDIQKLAKLYDVSADHVKEEFGRVDLEREFFVLTNPATHILYDLAVKKFEDGELSPEDTTKFNEARNRLSTGDYDGDGVPEDSRWAATMIDEKIQALEAFLNEDINDPHNELVSRINDNIFDGEERAIKIAFADHALVFEDGRKVIAVSNFSENPKDLRDTFPLYGELLPDDYPTNLPPASADQLEFLILLHEAEHTTQSQDKPPLHREIDADTPVVDALSDINPEMKEHWLQARNLSSFTYGLSGCRTYAADPQKIKDDYLNHDTATFLRQRELGHELDTDAFLEEKVGLLSKIQDKLPAYGTPKVGDIMAAAALLLDDPDSGLTEVQRAEAEQFIKDAKGLGYETNPDFVPAPPRTGNAPAAPVPQPNSTPNRAPDP